MRRSRAIRHADARELVRVVAEACESSADPRARVVAVASGLTRVIDARLSTVCHLASPAPGSPMTLIEYLEAGHWTDTDRRVLAEYYTRGDHEEDLVARSIADRQRRNDPDEPKPPALRREDLIEDRDWYNTAHFNEFRRASDIDACIYCGVPGDTPGQILGMTFHRSLGQPAFTPRERAMVEIVVTGAASLFRRYGNAGPGHTPTPAPAITPTQIIEPASHRPDLPKRLREVLEALLAGDSEKQAARRLDLSPHTIHGHVKRLYKHFGVSSRGELMARFLRRGG